MIAKQTSMSAALVVLIAGSTGTALADPAEPCDEPTGEAAPPGETPPCEKPAEPPPTSPTARKPTGTFQIGAGFNSVDGFVATARVAQDDLFRTGKHLSLDAAISARYQTFGIHFLDPEVFGSRLSFAADLYNTRRILPNQIERNAVGSALTLSHPLGEHVRGFIGYRFENVTAERLVRPLERDSSITGTGGDPPLSPGWVSAWRAGLVYSTLEPGFLPARGSSLGAYIERADRRLGSDVDFSRVSAWATHHRPIGPFILH